jgi:predicted alpha/beta hydrolase family esterase
MLDLKNKYFLIHGSMLGVPVFFKSKKALEKEINFGMYDIFEYELEAKHPSFYLFKWLRDFKNESRFNPLAPLRAYYKDKKVVNSKALQTRLYLELSQQEPTIICAHSMGAELLLLTIEAFGLPESVKTIYTINSDSDKERKLNNSKLEQRIKSSKLS